MLLECRSAPFTVNMELFYFFSPDELIRSDCSSLSSLPLDDGESRSEHTKTSLSTAVIIVWGISGRESVSIVTGVCVLYTDDSDSASQRPRSRSVQGSPQLSPMRSLGTEYDVERQGCPRENHHNKNHSRWGNGFPASHCVSCKVLCDV